MTEKRFTYGLRKGTTQYEIKDSLHEFPIVEPFYYESYAKKVCEFLNEQHEQIEDLKDVNVRCCNEYSYFHKRMMELEKENEQLKSELGKLNILYKAKCKTEEQLLEMGKEIEKENEQLKKREQTLTAKIDRILHQRDGNEKQHLKVMSYLHDNYYSIWEECLKELGD